MRTTLRIALRATEQALVAIRHAGHQRDVIPAMMTRQELYDLLDYRGYEERDRTYFG